MSIHAPLPKSSPAVWFGTFFGVGLIPFAPGTLASLVTLPLAWMYQTYVGDFLPEDGHWSRYTLVFLGPPLILFILGWRAMGHYMQATGRSDPKEMVIDEVAAQWLLCTFVPVTVQAYAVAFLLFRFFDILKPWPISWVDRKCKSAFGAMFDDILAALMPILLIAALFFAVVFTGKGVPIAMAIMGWMAGDVF